MDKKFESAVEWVARNSAPLIENGQFKTGDMDPSEPILRLYSGVYWIPDEQHGMASMDSGRMICHESAAAYLLSLCEKSPAAYDLLRSVCADHIFRELPLHGSLRTFSVLHLAGKLTSPKRVRASKTALRGIWLYTYAKTVQADFSLTLTRGDESRNRTSACDAVSVGMERNGHHLTYGSIKEICVGTSSKRLRAVSDLWVKAHAHARTAGIIPSKVLDRYWYFV